MKSNGIEIDRAILVGMSAASFDDNENSTAESLDELEALLETAGGVCCGRVFQNREKPDSRTYIGSGKALEVKELAETCNCNLIVFDNELSPSQTRALEDDIGICVMDRTQLILDIFAQRARTREGALQVELAQYKYMMPRLTGMWTHLVSQTASGGATHIGTRGPGETQLETDRRHIRRRLQKLTEELEDVRRIRATQRKMREKNGIPVVALVGYTNVGKSTILNKLTDSAIPANNRLFDTLDTTTRRLMVSPGQEVLLSDTVGFIRKLPHHLIEAFKATLEELKYADILLHVIDASSEEYEFQMQVVRGLISELGASETPCIDVYNKCDICPSLDNIPHGKDSVAVSAITGEGMDDLINKISEILGRGKKRTIFTIPYSDAGVVEILHREAEVINTEYNENEILVEAVVESELWNRLRSYSAVHDDTQ